MSGVSVLRRDQANAVHDRLVEAAIAVIESGEEPNMRSVAAAAQVSERTIYRYFPTRDDLKAALMVVLKERVSAPLPGELDGLEGYARQLFTNFARNAQLTRALTLAHWASPRESRQANLRALRALIDAAFPGAPKSERASAAASLRAILSASGWVYLDDCGFDLEASIGHVTWLVRTVLARLREQSGGARA